MQKRESGNCGFFPRRSVGYKYITLLHTLHSVLFLFPHQKGRKVVQSFQICYISLLKSFLTHFVFFELSVSRFVHVHFEPLLCDFLVCSKVFRSALIILSTIPTKATRGRVLNFYSVLLQLPHLTGSPDSHNVSSPCQLYELLRACARVLTRKIGAQKYVL